MFENLRRELKNKNISMVTFAKILGCTEKSVQNKLNGITEFTLSEVKMILDIFPQFKMSYIFAEEKKTA